MTPNQHFCIATEAGAFSDLKKLKTLYLNQNRLQTLYEGIFDPSNRPNWISWFVIYNNPLQCSVSLCWIKEADSVWLVLYDGRSYSGGGPYSGYYGSGYADDYCDDLRLLDLDCSTGKGTIHYRG